LTTKYADVFNSLSKSESNKLEKIIIDICKQRMLLTNDRPSFCPLCGCTEAKFIKRGKLPNGKQRYFCSSCSTRFVCDVHSISYKSNQPMEVWFKVIEDTIQLKSIKYTAKELDLTDITIFRLRHKFLHALEILMQEIDLENLIEMDETYVLESNKGTKQETRLPRKRGETALERGLSLQQICCTFACDRSGNVIAKCTGRGLTTQDMMNRSFAPHVSSRSILITDKGKSYRKLVERQRAHWHIIEHVTDMDEVIHINTVNQLHDWFKRIYKSYRGVASKYINRYLALFSFIKRCKALEISEIKSLLYSRIKERQTYVTNKQVYSEHLVTAI
ncbi:MAG: IS1595 family transposase, partial [Erysipelotrichaceae bacterium]